MNKLILLYDFLYFVTFFMQTKLDRGRGRCFLRTALVKKLLVPSVIFLKENADMNKVFT